MGLNRGRCSLRAPVRTPVWCFEFGGHRFGVLGSKPETAAALPHEQDYKSKTPNPVQGQGARRVPVRGLSLSYKTVKARFWPWLSGKSSENMSSRSLFARTRTLNHQAWSRGRATTERSRAPAERQFAASVCAARNAVCDPGPWTLNSECETFRN